MTKRLATKRHSYERKARKPVRVLALRDDDDQPVTRFDAYQARRAVSMLSRGILAPVLDFGAIKSVTAAALPALAEECKGLYTEVWITNAHDPARLRRIVADHGIDQIIRVA